MKFESPFSKLREAAGQAAERDYVYLSVMMHDDGAASEGLAGPSYADLLHAGNPMMSVTMRSIVADTTRTPTGPPLSARLAIRRSSGAIGQAAPRWTHKRITPTSWPSGTKSLGPDWVQKSKNRPSKGSRLCLK
ncbi:MAG: hypothetical protein ACC700_05950 [Anaerolineales bacterium]